MGEDFAMLENRRRVNFARVWLGSYRFREQASVYRPRRKGRDASEVCGSPGMVKHDTANMTSEICSSMRAKSIRYWVYYYTT